MVTIQIQTSLGSLKFGYIFLEFPSVFIYNHGVSFSADDMPPKRIYGPKIPGENVNTNRHTRFPGGT